MPAPAVYVAIAVGAVVTGYALKEFVFPHLRPKFEQMIHDFEAKARARKQCRTNPPMGADNPRSDDVLHRASSAHELQRIDHNPSGRAVSSGIELNVSSSMLSRANFRSHSETPTADDHIDPTVKSFSGQAPFVPETNPWASSIDEHPVSYSPSQNLFQLGSETPTVASETPPRTRFLSLGATELQSRSSSPTNLTGLPSDVQVQLPTPNHSPRYAARAIHVPYTSLEADDSSSNVDDLAPGVSRSTTTTMADSFVTANSPGVDFRSLPVTEPTSPRTEASFVSAEDDDDTTLSFPSSSASVPRITNRTGLDESTSLELISPTGDPFEDPFSGFSSFDRSPRAAPSALSAGSESEWSSMSVRQEDRGHSDDEDSNDGSWQDINSSPTSPRI